MNDASDAARPNEAPEHFVREMIAADVASGKHGGRVVLRFPPEPNGYLHIGHGLRPITLNFGLAQEFGGRCNLRFDDTNPVAEEAEFVDAILADVRWLGFDWGEHLYYASDYFDQLYLWAEELIGKGLAYVCDLSSDEIREYQGTLTEPGRPSPYRDRSVAENLDLFRRMKAGDFEPGARVLRAKIDMASSVLPMRDPVLYRIVKASHHRTGDRWCIYPMYDFAHPLSDAIEGVTHSLCSLEFTDHRPLYDWCVENCSVPSRPEQTEFGRVGLTYTVMSKRWMKRLVEEGHVRGWDDPRMATLAAQRRRGVPPAAFRNLARDLGLTRRNITVELARYEHAIRTELNKTAPRVMAVLHPLKVVIENWPEGHVEEFEAVNNPEDPSAGTRKVPFSRELYIEQDDFLEDPPKKFFRLAPGREVRLRAACLVKCESVVKDASGRVTELRCTWDPATRGGDAPDGRRMQATLHWVSAAHAIPAEVRLYETLFSVEDPMGAAAEQGVEYTHFLNPKSETVLTGARVEPSLAGATPGAAYQFERLGYFAVDPDSKPGALVFGRTVTLRDEWAKVQKKGG
ncbi:MAG: glutamine--tRNA ligase [Proteobacteria bacterium]|nr:MAG: glutamine--tRNA ligase [Pseudomonadota bacterium]